MALSSSGPCTDDPFRSCVEQQGVHCILSISNSFNYFKLYSGGCRRLSGAAHTINVAHCKEVKLLSTDATELLARLYEDIASEHAHCLLNRLVFKPPTKPSPENWVIISMDTLS